MYKGATYKCAYVLCTNVHAYFLQMYILCKVLHINMPTYYAEMYVRNMYICHMLCSCWPHLSFTEMVTLQTRKLAQNTCALSTAWILLDTTCLILITLIFSKSVILGF
jgi:hypothetical protein